jgi:hypothetical protein
MDTRHTEQEREERWTEQHVLVRQVTNIQASWTETERGAPGAFTLQLILDHGADEYILRPTAADLQVLLRLFDRGGPAMFDTARKVLMFSTRPGTA